MPEVVPQLPSSFTIDDLALLLGIALASGFAYLILRWLLRNVGGKFIAHLNPPLAEALEQQRVFVIVKFDQKDLARVLKEQNLGVDYRVRVRIITASKPDALVVPRSALFRAADGKWQV